ncbi:hypothetical protein CGLO_15348 [Colletotrichum gloeosporioides Cg-14]|uniref:Uncharacterized protein n=1 Tax=Colletotrichum gloeosporioides (strain Cg-14) TaxID=1237896 RepID=T0JZ19_COLGC|nr:hypothetical protein CGLO_15348 [Colletotrichum gloeosporioides Cg-14]
MLNSSREIAKKYIGSL